MKAIYLSVTGHAYAENLKATTSLVEMKDGYHPITNDSVFRDRERKDDAIVVIWQGVAAPEGANQTRQFITDVFVDIEIKKMAHDRKKVNKIWHRQVAAIIGAVAKYGLQLIIFIIIAYILVDAFIGGG